jgi:predicted transcriptional regulator
MSPESSNPVDFVGLAAGIIAAYVSHNRIARSDLPSLIESVHGSLRLLDKPEAPEAPALEPPVPIRKTITPDYLISLEDGKPYRSLKRHLTAQGLTPDAYRAKWGLPRDYPMVAANYSKQRAELARTLGLGRQGARARATPAPIPAPAPRRARPVKTEA